MRYIFAICFALVFISCSDSFVNHKLTFEKLGGCTAVESPVSLVSNINGERFQFDQCMDASFTGKEYTVERRSDTLVVDFPKTGSVQAMFRVTLDIDAKPAYRLILLDGRPVIMRAAEK